MEMRRYCFSARDVDVSGSRLSTISERAQNGQKSTRQGLE